MALISVIVPFYNVEPYIERCINSILAQTFVDFDLVLVDDGSNDRSGEICDRYQTEDARVHVIHQSNQGVATARNVGMEWVLHSSDSKWVVFVDGDDWVHPDYLLYLYDAAVESGLRISVCSYIEVKEWRNVTDVCKEKYRDITPEDFFVRSAVHATIPVAKLYEKALFENIRYPDGKVHEDVFVTHLLLFPQEKLAFIDIPLYYYYRHPGSITTSVSKKRLQDAVESQRIRIKYFQDNHFIRAYESELYSLNYNFTEQQAIDIGAIDGSAKERRKLRQRVRKRIRREKLSFSKYIWAYEWAYPNCMKIYWLARAVFRKCKVL